MVVYHVILPQLSHALHMLSNYLKESKKRLFTYTMIYSLSKKDYAVLLPDKDEDAFHMISNKSRKKFSKSIHHLKKTLVKAAKPILNELHPIAYLKLEELIVLR